MVLEAESRAVSLAHGPRTCGDGPERIVSLFIPQWVEWAGRPRMLGLWVVHAGSGQGKRAWWTVAVLQPHERP